MSQSDSLMRAMFDVQRTAIKQGEQAFKQGLATQRSANKIALAGLQGQESLQRQTLEITQAATTAYMNAVTSMMGNRGVPGNRRTVDEMFSQMKMLHAEFFDTMEREFDRSAALFDELSADYVDTIDQQTDQLLESAQTIEDRSAENFDEFAHQLHEQLERVQEVQDELEAQFERQSDHAEQLLQHQREQAATFQQQLEEEAEQLQRELHDQAAEQRPDDQHTRQQSPESEDQSASEGQLELIDGLGPTFRERLSDAGVRSIDDLVNSDPDTVAKAADVSRERAENWIEQASA